MNSGKMVVASLGILLLAGCVSQEVSNPNVTISVTSASSQPGACTYSSDPNVVCHILAVHVVNGNSKEDVENNMFYWEAVSAKGGVFKTPDKSGADAIAAGAQGDVTLKFEVTDGSNLMTLRYKAIWMSQAVTASIPSYGSQTGSPSTGAAGTTGSSSGLAATITNVTKTPGNCGQEYGDPICHIVSLHIVNGRTKDFSTNPYFWKATTTSGTVASYASDIDGPDAVAAGATADIKVSFEITGNDNLVKLNYDAYDAKLNLDVPSYPTARPAWPDNADKVTKISLYARASNEDSDAAKEGKVTINGENSDSKDFRFDANVHVKLEKQTSYYPETTYSTVGEWDKHVATGDFTGSYSVGYDYIIQDSNFENSEAYRVTVTASMTKTGQTLSGTTTLYYSNS